MIDVDDIDAKYYFLIPIPRCLIILRGNSSFGVFFKFDSFWSTILSVHF